MFKIISDDRWSLDAVDEQPRIRILSDPDSDFDIKIRQCLIHGFDEEIHISALPNHRDPEWDRLCMNVACPTIVCLDDSADDTRHKHAVVLMGGVTISKANARDTVALMARIEKNVNLIDEALRDFADGKFDEEV